MYIKSGLRSFSNCSPKDPIGQNDTKSLTLGHLGDLSDCDNFLAYRFRGFDFVMGRILSNFAFFH